MKDDDIINNMIYGQHNAKISKLTQSLEYNLEHERQLVKVLENTIQELRADIAKHQYAAIEQERILQDKFDLAKRGLERVYGYTQANKDNSQIISCINDLVEQYLDRIE